MSDYPLLPSDRYLARMLGITDEEYAEFKAEARKRYREGPAPLVVCEPVSTTLAIISLVASVISVGLTIIASFFKPKPGRPAQLKANDKSEDAINSVERYAPRVGFDAAQEIARIGQVIPLVYTKREQVNGNYIGGVRISCPLIWAQIRSYGGNQLLRAIFLVGEGQITSIDATNFAIGSNVIGAYLLQEAGNEARLSLYLKQGADAQRIKDTHFLTGRPPSTDSGRDSANDVFAVDGEPDFCSVSKPTTQTTFGLYAPIGNNLGFRVNPVFRPAVNAQLVPEDDGDAKVKCDQDIISLSQRKKYQAFFSTRSGLITGGSVSSIGATATYKLFKSSDKDTDFSVATAEKEWGIAVDIKNGATFFFGTGIEGVTTEDLKDLISTGTITVDAEERQLQAALTFNINEASALFANAAPGNYELDYSIGFTNENVDDGEEELLEKKWKIDVKVSQAAPTYSWGQTGAAVTDADWSYNSTTDTLTKVSGGSVNVTGDVTVVAGAKTIEFDGGPGTTSNAVTGLMTRNVSGKYNDHEFHEEKAGDVASTIASKQRGWDDSLIVGELYRVGSALCICSARTPDDVFQSEAEFEEVNGGKELEVTFTTVRPGQAAFYSAALLERSGKEQTANGDRKTGTSGPHIHRIAIGEVSTTRECSRVEIGLKSVLGIRVGGLCNFKDTLSFAEVDWKACKSKKGDIVSEGSTLKVDIYQSGVISCSVERMSFFRISYRESGTSTTFTDLGANFGIRGITQQNQFNGIKFTMPSKKRWTFRFEPVSGWEIRNGISSGPLHILDSKLQDGTESVITQGIATFKGRTVPLEAREFRIPIGHRGDVGNTDLKEEIHFTRFRDAENYIDGYGKLAEQFVYEEITGSTQGPEHEIVYINEIVENEAPPQYDNLAIIGLNIKSSVEWQQFSQFSCYVTGGINNTHLFPEILEDLLTNDRYGLGHAISAEQIDSASFAAAATWCSQRGYYFDGVISERQNIRQWAADVSATMLLIFGEANGRFFLRPAVPFGGAEIKGIFTADNILENTYQMQYFDAEDRLPIQVSIKYREERSSDSLTNPGVFPTERSILVREEATSETEKIEAIDVSDYVTSRKHAIDVAKFVIRMRRLPTHGIKFQTTYDGLTANLAPGDYIRCAIDSSYYDDFNNGVVSANGALTSTASLANGEYQVFAWDGSSGSGPQETTLTVSGGGTTATPTGIIFSVRNVVTSIRTYQIESIGIEENGAITIEAVHMPADEMTANWGDDASDGYWRIED